MTSLTIFGEAIPKRRVYKELENMPAFQETHSAKIRQLIDGLSVHTIATINDEMISAYDLLVPKADRAKAAFRVVSYFQAINPFPQPKRQFYQRLDGLVNLIHEDATALMMYGAYIKAEPDAELYQRLKAMDHATATGYRDYAVTRKVADIHGIDLSWLTNWSV